MTGPRVAIIMLTDPEGAVPVAFANNAFDVACELMAEGCQVSVSAWKGANIDELLFGLRDADRILLWDPDVTFDIAATRFALGKGQKLVDALDAADVVTAPVLQNDHTLAVFSGTECFTRSTEGRGTALAKPLAEERKPLPFGACGVFWLWMHATAIDRLSPPPARPQQLDGVDITLSRRLIEGGCSVAVDPRLAVVSSWREVAGWSLAPTAGEEAGAAPAEEPQS